MNWYYEAAGQQQGPISDSELDRLLAEGKITPDTLVWREGLPAWTPLRSTRVAAEGAAPPAFTAGARVPAAPPGEVPPGYIRCTLTGKYFPPSEIFYIEGRPYSAEAKPQVMQSLQAGSALPGNATDRIGPAWEQRATLGFLKSIWETITGVLTRPSETFSTMKREGGLGSPLLFLLLTAGVAAAISQVYGLLFQGVAAGMMGSLGAGQGGASTNPALRMNAAFGMSTAMQSVMIVIMPIILILGTFLYAGTVHLTLKLFGGANHRFESTMRAVCYTTGAAGVFNIIPFCGAYMVLIWGLVALCIGLGKVHDTTTDKGVGAAIVATVACCGLYGVGIMLFVGSVFASVGAFNKLGP